MAKKIEFDYLEVERLAGLGLSEQQIAESFGISRTTISARKLEDKTFLTALKRGKSRGIAEITNALFQSALNGNVTAQIFYLKCRSGWTENAEFEKRILELENLSKELN